MKFSGHLSDLKTVVDIELSIYLFKEDKSWIAYSPSLDLTGYGNSQKQAKDSFRVVYEMFIEDLIDKGNYHTELERLGWHNLEQPSEIKSIESNDTFAEILSKKEFKKFTEIVLFPA